MKAATPTRPIAIVARRKGAPMIAPDRDLLRALRAADDRDDRNQGLGHRRSDRRQERADGALAHLEPVAHPLDGVREEEARRRG